jgi:hypothetical protein
LNAKLREAGLILQEMGVAWSLEQEVIGSKLLWKRLKLETRVREGGESELGYYHSGPSRRHKSLGLNWGQNDRKEWQCKASLPGPWHLCGVSLCWGAIWQERGVESEGQFFHLNDLGHGGSGVRQKAWNWWMQSLDLASLGWLWTAG